MDFNAAEISTICGVVVAVIGALMTLAIKGINMVRTILNSKTENQMLQTLINNVSDNAENIVKALNQTLVNGLKDKSEDGKLTKDEIIAVKNEALTTLMNTLSVEAKTTLTNTFGNLELYLSNLIEAKVSDAHKTV